MERIIDIYNLQKSYGKHAAVCGVTFDVKSGEILALLGPNGAGKSTTIDILCTFIEPDDGSVFMDGFELGKENNEIRKRIGAVFQDGLLDSLLTVEENLYMRGRLYGLRGKVLNENVLQIANMTGIAHILKRRYGQLSGGQRRRCDIARALINTPKILFLDEPTTGLDPQMRYSVWETIQNIKEQTGMTIMLTTHYMEEAAQADQIIIMKEGKIAASGTPFILKEKYSRDRLKLYSHSTKHLADKLLRSGITFTQNGNQIDIILTATLNALPLLDFCRGEYYSFEVAKGNIDDVYLSITGKETCHD